MEFLWQTILNGLMISSFYALIAVGLSLVFGVMHIVNFAHGEFYMIGAYTVWVLFALLHWPFFIAVGAAIVIVGLLGLVSERLIFRHAHGNVLSGFIMSVGLVFILQVAVVEIWGVGKMKPVPAAFPQVLDIGGVSTSWQRFIVLPATIILLWALWYFLAKFRVGRGLRASAQDPEAAALYGISPKKSAAIAMLLGSAMAGAAGAFMAPIMSVHPYMGHSVVWTAFVVVIVGGAGNIKGTILAALIFGFLTTIITTLLDSTIANLVNTLVMLVILAIRPQGVASHAEE
ncbi:MAG TPA: branched-chain amino acid ABC transporter permease [Desulfobacteraceae bacterium]|nr:branched-chain amino acid ABC transporter permease [Desulfobacteraceae bacterium]